MDQRFQFSLRSLTLGVLAVCVVAAILRWLGSDAMIASFLMASAGVCALAGWRVGSACRGALFGAVLPVFYVLSIPVVEHIGHRAGWPGISWVCCSRYESLWYGPALGSESLWRGYWLWTTWCDDMSRQFGSLRPMRIESLFAMALVCGTMCWVRRSQSAVLVAPLGIIASGVGLTFCHDFDAIFLGLAAGSLGAIVVSRRNI